MPEDPLWYKDAVIYEVHIKSFCDSNDDGVGDIRGLTKRLDYLAGLGVTAIWLLPFYPSPLKDDGYDISDYMSIHPAYGNMRDFKEFLKEAHRRGLKVITEIVLNHTSDQHAWFQKARKSQPGGKGRDFYVWSDSPDRYRDARIIFKDFESSNWTWDPSVRAYYWHRFYSHQPDLNYENPEVEKAVFKAVSFWLDMGVDGLRLDAVPYLFEKEGTNCENLPETYAFLKKLRAYVDKHYKNRMLLAEANQWPEDASAYFGNGDCCHMAFHFPIMPRLFMASWMEDRFPIIDIFDQTPPIPDNCQWTLFLRNHDELTLEMVTDEERDYMYRVYAEDPVARLNLGIRRRLAPLLGNHRRKIELMNILLFSLPGTPVIYYGDEIGMGDNYYLGDRDGVRTPMQWSADRNAGFSRANPQKLYLPVIIDPEYHYEAVNVDNHERNQTSLLWWMKRMISMRKRYKSFGRGGIEFLSADNPKILAFVRQHGDESILVAANLSRFPQVAELDLSKFSGFYPEEVFSKNPFPPIKEGPYVLTFGPHDYFWFVLKMEEEAPGLAPQIPTIVFSGSWIEGVKGKLREKLEDEVLPIYLRRCRWFGSKGRKIQAVKVVESIPVGKAPYATQILLVRVAYTEGEPETYLLPLSYCPKEREEVLAVENPASIIAYLQAEGSTGIICDAAFNEEFRKSLLTMMARRQVVSTARGRAAAYPGRFLRRLKGLDTLAEKSRVLKAEQSNTSIVYGSELILKLFRRLHRGVNPELEMTRFLSERGYTNVPPFGGAIEYRGADSEPLTISVLHAMVPNQGDAWTYALDSLGGYFERAVSRREEVLSIPPPAASLLDSAEGEMPPLFRELSGGVFLELVSLLAKRTAEMHLWLASGTDLAEFSPEPFSLLYQRSIFQTMQSSAKRVFSLLRKNLKSVPAGARKDAEQVLGREKDVISSYRDLLGKKFNCMKTRIHGDFHLGQVLFTGNDFVIIDFEGEPAVPISERRIKRSPLRDVAGMTRSFQYASYSSLLTHPAIRPEDIESLEPVADLWYRHISAVFLKSYLESMKGSAIIPEDKDELEVLLKAYTLEKAVYEIGYEINNRPDWVVIPVKGIKYLLEG